MEDEVNEILQEVVKILWNADYAKADELLAPHKDNHPAVATMYAQSMWLRVHPLFPLLLDSCIYLYIY
jgi:hypothetical protein